MPARYQDNILPVGGKQIKFFSNGNPVDVIPVLMNGVHGNSEGFEVHIPDQVTATNDFWRSGVGATTQPDGVNDLTEIIRRNGKVGINKDASAILDVQGSATDANIGSFKSFNGAAAGYAVRGETVNSGAALGVYGELGVWDGTRWSGVRGNSGVLNAAALVGINTIAGGISAYFNERVAIGIITPTSNVHINGSEAGAIVNITATLTLSAIHHKVLVSNGATNITITLPDALTCLGREYIISRAAGSTGSITIQRTGTNIVQALNGTTGATTSIGLHTATGGGLNHSFTAINIAGVGFWVRI